MMHVHETTVCSLGRTCDPDLENADWLRKKIVNHILSNSHIVSTQDSYDRCMGSSLTLESENLRYGYIALRYNYSLDSKLLHHQVDLIGVSPIGEG
jgi:hypothetical protein